MTNITTATSFVGDREARLRSELARLDKEIRETRQEVECLQERLDELEIERSDLLDELDDGEG